MRVMALADIRATPERDDDERRWRRRGAWRAPGVPLLRAGAARRSHARAKF